MGLALGAAFIASQFSTSPTLIMGIGGVIVFLVSFVSMEAALYILIFSMLLSPEIIVGGSPGTEMRGGVTLRAEDLLLVVIGVSWFARNAIFKELGLFLKTPLNQAIFFYILSCVVSTGLAIVVGRVVPKTGFFYVVKYIEYFIVFFMVVNQMNDTDQVKRFVLCLLLTCFIVSIIGIFQIPGGGRVSAPFEGAEGEPNTFGGYLMFIMAIIGGLFLKFETTRIRLILVFLLITIIPPFLYTQSRASYLGALAVCFVLAFMSKRRAILLTLMVIGLIVSPILLPSTVRDRLAYTFTQPEEAGQIAVGGVRLDTSLSARVVSYQQAMVDFTKHPILGHGVTGYRFLDAQFPRVLAETGFIGMVAFLYLLYSIFNLAMTNLQLLEKPLHQGVTIGFLAGFIGLVVHSLGANTFIIVRIMEPFWFFAGIVVVLPEIEQKYAETHYQTPPRLSGVIHYG